MIGLSLFDALSNMQPAVMNHPLDYPVSDCLFRGLGNFTVTSWWDWKSHELPREQGRTGHAAQRSRMWETNRKLSTPSLSRFRWIYKNFSDRIITAFWRCWRTLKSLVSPPARQILCTQDAEDWTAAPFIDVSWCIPLLRCRSLNASFSLQEHLLWGYLQCANFWVAWSCRHIAALLRIKL